MHWTLYAQFIASEWQFMDGRAPRHAMWGQVGEHLPGELAPNTKGIGYKNK